MTTQSSDTPQNGSTPTGQDVRRPEDLAREREALYAVFVQTITATEARRQQLSLGFAAMGAALATAATAFDNIEPVLVSLTVLVIAFVWWRSLQHYKRLARSKFRVIARLEDSFDIKPFREEWEHFKEPLPTDGGTDPHRIRLSDIEMFVPRLMMLGSIAYLCWYGWKQLQAFAGPAISGG